ncbi:MAG: RNA methyltransferase [Candidatus Gastranaerophilales bacterium]|nr:RNA methyltransferase [Candidatus Gastranaerophilales bacterium]
MKEITSVQNPLIKEVAKLHQKKYRDEFILLEGVKAVEEALLSNLEIKYIFSKTPFLNLDTYIVNDAVLKKISTTESPGVVVAVAKKPVYNFSEFLKFKKIALLDGIKDAGNLGTIIRAACAFQIEGILLYGDTTDEFSPKTIRSSAGNMFKIPILKVNKSELIELKKTHKFIAATVNSNNFSNQSAISDNPVIMLGSETMGLCKELLNLADETITIKMSNSVESLNLALSAGILFYELQK